MALMECSFFAETLGMSSSAYVVVPQTTRGQIGLSGVGTPDGCPVLYLLHGLSDDHSIWMRRTSIERYAAAFGIAVVMPNGHRSFYTDMVSGLNYFTYISQELPEIIGSFFKFSRKREDTFVAGLSMGGYGALKLALNCPEKYAAGGCFSSVIRPEHLLSVMPDRKKEFETVFGDMDKLSGSMNDLYAVSEKQKKSGADLPELFLACGTEDFLYQENLSFKSHLEKLQIPFEFLQEPGTHEWGFWDRQIQNYLKFLVKHELLKTR